MDKWSQLIKSLDVVFGFGSNKKSSIKKLKQFYDEKQDEHVFVIEYRVIKGDNNLQNENHEFEKYKPGELIREINSRVSGETGPPGKFST